MPRVATFVFIRWVLLLFLAVVLLLLDLRPTDTSGVASLPQNAVLLSANAGAQTEEFLQRIIARHPLDPQPWHQLGDFFADRDRLDDALYAYGQALRRGDATTALNRSLAQLYAGLGDLRRSLRLWDVYLSRHPTDDAARLTLAQTAIRLADWERAQAELEILMASDERSPLIHAWLGLLLVGTDPAVGTFHLRHAARDPDLAVVLTELLAVDGQAKPNEESAYRDALLGVALLDVDIPTLFRLSGLESTEEELGRALATLAVRSFLAAVYRSPGYADAYAYLGQALDQLGLTSWAEAALRYAHQLAPESPVVQTLTGLFWDRQGSPSLARQYYEAAFKHDQDSTALCLEIAATYAAQGQYTAAEVWLHHAAGLAPEDPEVWKILSQFYLDSGIDVEVSGLSAALRLLELAPNDAYAHDLLGWAYVLIGEDTLASTSLTQALALDPALASAHYHLGRLYARQGRHDEAVTAYRRAADLDLTGQLDTQLERAWDELSQTTTGEP